MRSRLPRFRIDPLAALRKRLIAETELALLIGLRFPARMKRIPMMEAGPGRFHPDFAAGFWREALGIDPETFARTSSLWTEEDRFRIC